MDYLDQEFSNKLDGLDGEYRSLSDAEKSLDRHFGRFWQSATFVLLLVGWRFTTFFDSLQAAHLYVGWGWGILLSASLLVLIVSALCMSMADSEIEVRTRRIDRQESELNL